MLPVDSRYTGTHAHVAQNIQMSLRFTEDLTLASPHTHQIEPHHYFSLSLCSTQQNPDYYRIASICLTRGKLGLKTMKCPAFLILSIFC